MPAPPPYPPTAWTAMALTPAGTANDCSAPIDANDCVNVSESAASAWHGMTPATPAMPMTTAQDLIDIRIYP
jgi:hypothetical protein